MLPQKIFLKLFRKIYLRPRLMVVVAGVMGVTGYGALAIMSRSESLTVWHYLAVMAGQWALLAGLFLGLRRRLTGTVGVALVIGWAVVFRLVGLWAVPIFEDDYFRYFWDGRLTATVGTPYTSAPFEYFGDPSLSPQENVLLDHINYPDYKTVYGPIVEFIFYLAHLIKPGSLVVLKLMYLLMDLLIMILLSRLVKPPNLIVYAWCPLLIVETAFSAHFEVVGILFLVGTLASLRQQHFKLALFLFGLALGARIQMGVLLPFVLMRVPVRYWAIVPLSFALGYLPFLGHSLEIDLTHLRHFALDWEFNSSLFGALKWAFGSQWARWVSGGFILGWIGWVWHLHQRRFLSGIRGDVVLAGVLLAGPVLNPWYAVVLVPFVAMFPRVWSMVFLAALSLSYITEFSLQQGSYYFLHPAWVRGIEFGVIYTVIAVAVMLKRPKAALLEQPPVAQR